MASVLTCKVAIQILTIILKKLPEGPRQFSKPLLASLTKCTWYLFDWKYKRRKIRFGNFIFKQIDKLRKAELYYSKEQGLYCPDDNYDVAIIKLTSDRINLENIFTAIGHSDFPPRQPRLDNSRSLTSKEVYFLNIGKKFIFHMYDDRGLDIIAKDKETLRSIYERHSDLILSYDREQIDKQFE